MKFSFRFKMIRKRIIQKLYAYDYLLKKLPKGWGMSVNYFRIYGYILEDSIGATADINLFIRLEPNSPYKIEQWEDIHRPMMAEELESLLDLKVHIHTERTLKDSFQKKGMQNPSLLIDKIIKISVPLKVFLDK